MRYLPLLAVLFAVPAQAGVLDVSSPSVKEGVIGLEAWTAWERIPDAFEHVAEASYGVTSFWKSAIELTAERAGGAEAEYAATAWKNTFKLLSQTQDTPVALGLRLDYAHAHLAGDADKVDARILLRNNTGPWEWRLNLGIEREVGDNAASGIAGDVRGSARYQVADGYKVAIDYLGDTGTLHTVGSLSSQDHRAGPVLLADLTKDITLEAGYLAGLSTSAPDHSFKLGLEYNF